MRKVSYLGILCMDRAKAAPIYVFLSNFSLFVAGQAKHNRGVLVQIRQREIFGERLQRGLFRLELRRPPGRHRHPVHCHAAEAVAAFAGHGHDQEHTKATSAHAASAIIQRNRVGLFCIYFLN